MNRWAHAVVAAGVTLLLTACQVPLSLDYVPEESSGYISDETLKKITDDGLTALQVRSLLGDPTSSSDDGKAMGYLHCWRWSEKCLGLVFMVPVYAGACGGTDCRQVGIWFDDTGHAAATKSLFWQEMLRDQCSLELWLSNHGQRDCYSQDPVATSEALAQSAGDLALVAPGDRYAGVASIRQGGTLFFSRAHETYVDWHRALRLEPGVYTIYYYVSEGPGHGPARRTDELELKPGHGYRVGTDYCQSWSEKHGCSVMWSMIWQANKQVTYLWLEDVTSGQLVSGSKTEPASASLASIDPYLLGIASPEPAPEDAKYLDCETQDGGALAPVQLGYSMESQRVRWGEWIPAVISADTITWTLSTGGNRDLVIYQLMRESGTLIRRQGSTGGPVGVCHLVP